MKLQQTSTPLQFWQGGVDWLGASASDHKNFDRAQLAFLPFHVSAQREGAKITTATRNGYWGHATEHTFLGRRDDGMFMQASSKCADDVFRSVMAICDHVARLDVQETVWIGKPVSSYLNGLYVSLDAKNRQRARPLYLKANVSSRQVQTIYINSPQSDQRGRIYDKFEESGDEFYRGAVRYEVQLRNRRASAAAKYLYGQPVRPIACASLATTWYNLRGADLPQLDGTEQREVKLSKRQRSNETSMHWISDQVSSTLLRLLREVGPEPLNAALVSAFPDQQRIRDAALAFLLAVGNYSKLWEETE